MIFNIASIILLILAINGYGISLWIPLALSGASIIWALVLYRCIYNLQKTVDRYREGFKNTIDLANKTIDSMREDLEKMFEARKGEQENGSK